MQANIKFDQLESAIKNEFNRFSQYSAEMLKESVDEVAKKVKRNIQENAPVRTGAYKKSWSKETTKETPTGKSVKVFSKPPHYRLTHLLEKGHRIVSTKGKDTGKRTRAFPHILPEEANAEKELIDELEKRLNNYV